MKQVYQWLKDRYPIDAVREFSRHQAEKFLPPHTSWFHTFGSLLLFLLLNQIATGLLLMVYYRATPETAFESTKYITTKAFFGWLIRGLHAWGATLMIIILLVHMLRTFIMGAYKKPRELTWITGVLIFGGTLTFGFTGYLLPWNQLSYWATTVGTEITGSIPLVGEPLKVLLRGGEAIGAETLSRFFLMHVSVLPWIMVFLVAIHIVIMRVQGLATMAPVGQEPVLNEQNAVKFFPEHVYKELVIFPLFFGILICLALIFPIELGEKADPFTTPESVKPEWYFLPTYQLLKYFPELIGILVSVIPFIVLLIWPFLDRSTYRHPRKRPISMIIGMGALLLAIFFGILGHFSERNITIFGKKYHVDIYGVPHKIEDAQKPSE